MQNKLVVLNLALGLAGATDAHERRLWGADGHMITAKVAMAILSADELSWTKGILSGGQDLAGVATWADEVKHSEAFKWSAPLHFINSPDGACAFDWTRDCKDAQGVPERCVAGAIVNYTQRLVSPSLNSVFASCAGLHKADCVKNTECSWDWTGTWTTSCKTASGPGPAPKPSPSPSPGPSPGPSPAPSPGQLGEKDEALRFITHFMGDIHQPLHDGWISDLGGNTIKVEEGFNDDKKFNLHQVWDEGIIQKKEDDASEKWDGYAASLVKQVQGAWASDATKWASCLSAAQPDLKACLTEMAQESIALDCTSAYKDDKGKLIKSGDELDDDYYKTRSTIIDQRLAQGGVRLAALLKHIKASSTGAQPTLLV